MSDAFGRFNAIMQDIDTACDVYGLLDTDERDAIETHYREQCRAVVSAETGVPLTPVPPPPPPPPSGETVPMHVTWFS